MLDKLLYIQSAIDCGLHSNIKPCCIKFFILEKLWMSDEESKDYLFKMDARFSELNTKSWGYIPCPTCLSAGSKIEIKKCPNEIICHPGDSRVLSGRSYLMSDDLILNIENARIGFSAIKSGKISANGYLSKLVNDNLDFIKHYCRIS